LISINNAWLKEKIIHEVRNDEFALKALQAAEEEIKSNNTASVKSFKTPSTALRRNRYL
jgi:hypothetical protein